ncbi:MAG TPA: NAD(P)-dependent oxidoreductase [Steroidobacteraceae bacterium]|nr:NAD(P)-dependent oxidoreductase [Steroidobacteraceae bacterium]
MGLKVFVAGGSGAVGHSLLPLLREAGHDITATTRTSAKREVLRSLGCSTIVVDVFDQPALDRAVQTASPDVVIHQLTDLSAGLDPNDPSAREKVLRGNARLRREGTGNLVRAARGAGVSRVIAQSIAWAYAPKTPPYLETDPLDSTATGIRALSVVDGVIPLERSVLDQQDFIGIVLRYGQLYGPGTWASQPAGDSPLHLDAAAYAALLAIDRGPAGAYNIAEPGGAVVVDKAMRELGWRADFRLAPPRS